MHDPNGQWNIPPCFYRVSVKAIIVREGRVLMTLLPSGMWELPGGGLDWGEDFHSALKRELNEELGITTPTIDTDPLFHLVSTVERPNMTVHALALCFRTSIGDATIVPNNSEDALDAKYFSREELRTLDIFPQSAPLRMYFDPTDFLT